MNEQDFGTLGSPNDNLITLQEINDGKSVSEEGLKKIQDFIKKMVVKAHNAPKDSLDAVLDVADKQMRPQRGGGATRSRSWMQQNANR